MFRAGLLLIIRR